MKKEHSGTKHKYLEAHIKSKSPSPGKSQAGKGKTSKIPTLITEHPVRNLVTPTDKTPTTWKDLLPSATSLLKTDFGQPDRKHSFTQEAYFETIIFHILKSNYLDMNNQEMSNKIMSLHPLVIHMYNTIHILSPYDFTWIRNIDTNWADQKSIQPIKRKAMMACLYHYNMDIGLLMCYLGNNYTGSYQNVTSTAGNLINHRIEPALVNDFIRVMTVGCPNLFVAKTTQDNALEYWRAGNNPSIKTNLTQVMNTMNKEDREQLCCTTILLGLEVHPTRHVRTPTLLTSTREERPPNQ